MKKVLSLFLSIVTVINVILVSGLTVFADETNPYRITVSEDIVGPVSEINAGSLVQNNADLNNNQLTITANGSKLSVSGKTTLPLLPDLEGYVPYFVTSFKNLETGVFGAPYIGMAPVECTAENGEKYYSFSGEYDFSNAAVSEGKYKMYLWRAYKEENRNYYKLGSSLNAGILNYANTIEKADGVVKVLKSQEIANANTDAYSLMNAYGTEDFLDASLPDLMFANKDPQDSQVKGTVLTDEEVNYIAALAKKITSGCKTDYEKIKSIYEYVSANVYYDVARPSNIGSNPANSNPYVNLKGIEEKTSNGYNITAGKTATNCVGYAAMVASLARTLGIPARIINGVHNTDKAWSEYSNLNTANHHWTECYVNGRWIMVDANAGTQNSLKSGTYTYTGLTNYTYFDATKDEIDNNYLIKSIYKTEAVPEVLEVPKASYTVNPDGSFLISWNKIPGANKYEIYYSTDNGETYNLAVTNVFALSYKTGVATFGYSYKYKVRAYNDIKDIKSDFSNVVNAVNTVSLRTPELAYETNSDGTFKLLWNRITGANYYDIYLYNDKTGKYELLSSTQKISYVTDVAEAGRVYKYIVKAVSSDYNVESPESNEIVAVNGASLPAPKAVYTVNSNRTFTISWNKVEGADKYEIYSYNKTTGKYSLIKTTTALSHTTGTATFGTTYNYKIRAVDSVNDSKSDYCDLSAVNNKYMTKPTATYTVNSDRTFTLSWNKIAGADKYEIYSYNKTTGKYSLIKTTTALSHTTGTATFGTTYKYIIKAVSTANSVKSPDSNIVSAVNDKYMAAPTVTYTVNPNRTFTISWNKIAGADKYEIYSYNKTTGKYSLIKTTTALSHTTGTATFGTTYKYIIKAVNSADNLKSPDSKVLTAVNDKYMAAPTVTYTVNSNRTFTISWNKIAGADKYEVYSYNKTTGKYSLIKITTALSHTTGTATFGTTYKYIIKAVSTASNVKSPDSKVLTAVNDKYMAKPTAKLDVNANGTFTISWNSIAGAAKYEVYIYDSRINDYRLSRTATTTFVTTSVAAKGVTYKYKVRAVSADASVISEFSNVVTGVR